MIDFVLLLYYVAVSVQLLEASSEIQQHEGCSAASPVCSSHLQWIETPQRLQEAVQKGAQEVRHHLDRACPPPL